MSKQNNIASQMKFDYVPNLGCIGSRHVALTNWQHRLATAEDARATAKVDVVVLFDHERETARRENEARMDQAVERLGSRLDHFLLLLGQALVCRRAQLRRA